LLQGVGWGIGQSPIPSQTLGLCWVPSLQLASVVPQAVDSPGKLQAALVLSQSVAPQGAVVLVQADMQQCPLPLIPQTSDVQASFSVQAPAAIWASQAPASVTQKKPLAQSVVAAQVLLQAVAAALQPKLLAQAAVVGSQVPVASQVLVVAWPIAHEFVPQAPPAGYTQAPLPMSHEVGSQAGSAVAPQAVVQQLPVPPRPQTPEVQSSFSLQLPTAAGLTQAAALQTKPVAQSLLVVQVVAQVVALSQPKLPLQAVWVPAAQVPEPLQVPAEVRTPSLQATAPHEVPEVG
jgi:hypothetical protein